MTDDGRAFTAVQEDATSFCMDWPVFEPGGTRGAQGGGSVFVLDSSGARMCDSPLTATNNRAADEALNRIGWTRCGAWHLDAFGRRSARVIAVHAPAPVRLPGQNPSIRIESLADEACLHLA